MLFIYRQTSPNRGVFELQYIFESLDGHIVAGIFLLCCVVSHPNCSPHSKVYLWCQYLVFLTQIGPLIKKVDEVYPPNVLFAFASLDSVLDSKEKLKS